MPVSRVVYDRHLVFRVPGLEVYTATLVQFSESRAGSCWWRGCGKKLYHKGLESRGNVIPCRPQSSRLCAGNNLGDPVSIVWRPPSEAFRQVGPFKPEGLPGLSPQAQLSNYQGAPGGCQAASALQLPQPPVVVAASFLLLPFLLVEDVKLGGI